MWHSALEVRVALTRARPGAVRFREAVRIAVLLLFSGFFADARADATLRDCRVGGLRNSVQCGSVQRPLDPALPAAGSLTVSYVVVPALARNKLPDPIFVIAGGPGQSAIAVAGQVMGMLGRANNRRDIVFVDQRGTGRSAPLDCDDPAHESLADQADPARQLRLLLACKARLAQLPYIREEKNLAFFTTPIAAQDLDVVRVQLGADRIDLIGFSYGTRVALEYLRQFPQAVRRLVIDGVAPADMVLPVSFSVDGEASLEALLAGCAKEAACAAAHPRLREQLGVLLATLPKAASVPHPLTGQIESFTLTREMVLSAIRSALYTPALAAAVPAAIEAASKGRYEGLVGLGATFWSRRSTRLATGMHFSVVCAEDEPRVASATDAPASFVSATFARDDAHFYARMCAHWPRGALPAAFDHVSPSKSPVLALSGGIDPATPPRHAARVVRELGPLARHVVVAHAGHGVMALGCMREVVFRFIDATTDAAAVAVDATCAQAIPRPLSFQPLLLEAGASR